MPRSFITSVVGSYIRPKWLIDAFKAYEEGKMDQATFNEYVEEAVRVAVKDQELAGIDVVTDGEQWRKSFVAFVGQRLRGFKVVHATELHPNAIEIMKRHKAPLTYWRPVIAGKIEDGEIVVDEVRLLKRITGRPIKVTLPSPYLIMWESWHSSISSPHYPTPEDAAFDYAKVLRREVQRLADMGVAFVQLDEPMLGDLIEAGPDEPDRYKRVSSEIYGQRYRGFKDEVRLAIDLINEVVSGIGGVRIGVHLDRWPTDESPVVGYERLAPDIFELKVRQYVVEYAAPRMGDPEEFARLLPSDKELGLGVVDVRSARVETPEEVVSRVEKVLRHVDPTRVWLNPDCGFAPGMYRRPFPRQVAIEKMRSMVEAARRLRERYWWY